MKFAPLSTYAEESEDGRFRISRSVVRGEAIYTAWKQVSVENRSTWVSLLYTRLRSAAIAACLMDPDWKS